MKSGNVDGGGRARSAFFNAANINDVARVVRMGGAEEEEEEEERKEKSKIFWSRAFAP